MIPQEWSWDGAYGHPSRISRRMHALLTVLRKTIATAPGTTKDALASSPQRGAEMLGIVRTSNEAFCGAHGAWCSREFAATSGIMNTVDCRQIGLTPTRSSLGMMLTSRERSSIHRPFTALDPPLKSQRKATMHCKGRSLLRRFLDREPAYRLLLGNRGHSTCGLRFTVGDNPKRQDQEANGDNGGDDGPRRMICDQSNRADTTTHYILSIVLISQTHRLSLLFRGTKAPTVGAVQLGPPAPA
jgi:hypothetical protein